MASPTRWDADLVTVVERRLDVLDALDQPREKRDLLDDVDVSRSTMDRAIRELESLGLVDRNDGYHLTVTGRLVFELFEGLFSDLDDVGAARELLGHLPRDAPMSPAMLRGARVEVAESPSPTSVLEHVLELFREAERMRAFSVAISRPDYADDIRDILLSDELPVECIYTPDIVEFGRENRENFEEFVAEAPVDPYVHPDLPYALRLADLPDGKAVAITIYDEVWTPRGVLLNDTDAAYDWAADLFERRREAADPLEP